MSSIIQLDIFCDEIKEVIQENPYGMNEKWFYMGMLLVPVYKKLELFDALMRLRCKNGNNWYECDKNCGYHNKNGVEIHYQEVRSADVFHIAKEWLNNLIDNEYLYFYFIGINTTRLNFDFFGDSKGSERFYRIYNRFFRTALQKSAKSYFSKYDTIEVRKVIHDRADIENHSHFPWHSIFKLDMTDQKLQFATDKISFLDSDHRVSQDRN